MITHAQADMGQPELEVFVCTAADLALQTDHVMKTLVDLDSNCSPKLLEGQPVGEMTIPICWSSCNSIHSPSTHQLLTFKLSSLSCVIVPLYCISCLKCHAPLQSQCPSHDWSILDRIFQRTTGSF